MSYPRGVIPTEPGEHVHPTPVYEMLAFLAIFFVLWRLRGVDRPPWWLFGVYMILAGTERFLIEFIRLNAPLWLGLTEAQLVSIGVVAAGAGTVLLLEKRRKRTPA
jgi:phosphatidylglycerol:prolipoprotein diacylglycerol transferase